MQKLLLIFISLFCLNYNYASSQDMKIKWEDSDGREFSIKVISREFEWSSIAGDKIRYNRAGWIKEVGNLNIKYNRAGQIIETTGTVN